MTTVSEAATTPTRGERRLAVLLFADLSGYTRLCRTLDPEDVAATVLPLLADVRAAVSAEGGLATGTAGDGFLAVFGVPVSHTDIADRAVRAATEMRRIVHARSIALSDLTVPDIHIGITAGEVLAYPSDDPSGFSFIGPAINLAARLSDAASAGCILVDDELRRLLSDSSCLTSPRDLVLQGHEEGVRVWDLEPAPVLVARGDVPFVGRHDLLERLDLAWAQTPASRQPRVVHLVGEAGIGKSTLLREWAQRRAALPVAWVNCVDVARGAQVEEVMHQLWSLTHAQQGLPRPPARRSFVNPSGEDIRLQAREVLHALREFGEAGVAIVIDDFQAADDELRAVVEVLPDLKTPAPTLILCATRSDDGRELGDPGGESIVVPPLDDAAVTELVTSAIGAPPPAPVVNALLTRAEGHPLAALQSSAYLVESETVVVRDERCELVHPQQLAELPGSTRLFVAGRLDRLPPSEKQLLQEMSALGTTLASDLVTRLFGAQTEPVVSALVARGFIVRDDADVRFSHGLVHEVAYASLPRSVRARLHRRIVEEQAVSDSASRALHARRWATNASETSPGERRMAIACALRETLAHSESLYVGHVRNAAAEAKTVRPLIDEDATVAPAESARLLALLANCDIRAGRYDEALSEAARAIDLARTHALGAGVLVAALSAQGEALSLLRHYQSARQSLEEALHLAEASADDAGRGRALRLLGDTYRHSDSVRLLSLTEEAFDVLAACGDEQGAADAARAMAYWLSVSTAPRLQRWVDEAERRTSPDDVCGRLDLARTRAFAAAARLEPEVAREQGRQCRELGAELGISDALVEGLMVGIESAAALGMVGEALDLLAELQALATARAEPRLRQMSAVFGLQPLQRAGAADRVQDAVGQAIALRDAFGPPETMMAAAALGLAARDRGAWAESLEHLQVALAAADAAGFALSALMLRAELVLTSALLGVTAPDAGDVIERAESGGAPAVASYTRAAVALLDDEANPDAAAATLLEAAVRADARALRLERAGDDACAAWSDAAAAWGRLGLTVFLARAQARAGDRAAAERTLDAIGGDTEGRTWALGAGC